MFGAIFYRYGCVPTTCKNCGNGILVKTKGKRREFCSPSCRTRYSNRKAGPREIRLSSSRCGLRLHRYVPRASPRPSPAWRRYTVRRSRRARSPGLRGSPYRLPGVSWQWESCPGYLPVRHPVCPLDRAGTLHHIREDRADSAFGETLAVMLEGWRGRGILVGEGLELRDEICAGRPTALENDVRYISGGSGHVHSASANLKMTVWLVVAGSSRSYCEVTTMRPNWGENTAISSPPISFTASAAGVLKAENISETDCTSRMSASPTSQSWKAIPPLSTCVP